MCISGYSRTQNLSSIADVDAIGYARLPDLMLEYCICLDEMDGDNIFHGWISIDSDEATDLTAVTD